MKKDTTKVKSKRKTKALNIANVSGSLPQRCRCANDSGAEVRDDGKCKWCGGSLW